MSRAERATRKREQLIDAAARALEEKGPQALNARGLGKDIGASTSAIYHHFGDMPTLLRAVVDLGFDRLDQTLAAVPSTEDAITDIAGLALAYRAAARRGPHLYDLMFGLSAPGGQRPTPSPGISATQGPARQAFLHLVHAVERGSGQGRLRGVPAEPVAAQLWSMLHGYVGLELSGLFDDLSDPLGEVLLPMGTNLIIGLGDHPEDARRSAAAALHPHPRR
ncbi:MULTISPECIES: TetR/AcrR family transcriptional regulator [unclassified Pseudonocardia]|uniref:TetR/AcrR family transcriptional regulator n=1 Tax=unclassified Pseudonocardia TaxID=2619320 RepID=UPI0001FFEDF2|nr:TetR/AcrR family transcriptional regulator [Pseudonocardia sp. Ae707_Ps1]OLM20333.1 Transcriptional regulator, TetR family [Pseudonocardia sp. Ae707_Ps1]